MINFISQSIHFFKQSFSSYNVLYTQDLNLNFKKKN